MHPKSMWKRWVYFAYDQAYSLTIAMYQIYIIFTVSLNHLISTPNQCSYVYIGVTCTIMYCASEKKDIYFDCNFHLRGGMLNKSR